MLEDKNIPMIPTSTEAELSLGKKLGPSPDLRKIFPSEKIQRSQRIVTRAQDALPQRMTEKMLQIEHMLLQAKSDISALNFIDVTASIRGQSESLGFTLLAFVAKSLQDFCARDIRSSEINHLVIRQHLDAMHVIVRMGIRDDGQQAGKQLMQSLKQLTEKYTTVSDHT